MKLYHCIKLFLGIVWREWEPKSCGIPESYRVHYRMGLKLSWQIAREVWR
jgi:hypothetical protein